MSTDLERRLLALGRYIEFPPTPPMAALVRPHLEPAIRRPLVTRRRAALAAVIAMLIALFAVPPVRTAIAHWLGIQGVVINPVTTLPSTSAAAHATPPSAPSSGLGLGQQTSLAAARQSAGFTIVTPASLGAPTGVYLRSDLGPVISLVYSPRPGLPESATTGVGLLITEFRGAADPMLIQKFVGPGTTVMPVSVGGGAGFWLDGAPHEIAYLLPDGSFASDTLRLAGPTLVFERGDVTIRIEGSLSEAQALAVANSLF